MTKKTTKRAAKKASKKTVSKKKTSKKVAKKSTKTIHTPSHEEISLKAFEIYQERLSKCINGSAEDDWYTALSKL